MSNLIISIFQTNPKYADVVFNLEKIKAFILQQSSTSDLILLPEMFNTSYIMEPKDVAESINGMTISTLTEFAEKYAVSFIGSIPMIRAGKYYNTAIVVDENGLQFTYDKIHLYTPAGEAEKYTAGKEGKIYTLNNGIKIKPLVCYDLRFPYLSFNKDKEKYDVLIYTANWPTPRIAQWKSLLIARAIENQCYVIGVNRVGNDGNDWVYPGQSVVVNYKGEILSELDNKEQATTLKLDMDEMYDYRSNYPFLGDVVQ